MCHDDKKYIVQTYFFQLLEAVRATAQKSDANVPVELQGDLRCCTVTLTQNVDVT